MDLLLGDDRFVDYFEGDWEIREDLGGQVDVSEATFSDRTVNPVELGTGWEGGEYGRVSVWKGVEKGPNF
jgi:hypothetical protein